MPRVTPTHQPDNPDPPPVGYLTNMTTPTRQLLTSQETIFELALVGSADVSVR